MWRSCFLVLSLVLVVGLPALSNAVPCGYDAHPPCNGTVTVLFNQLDCKGPHTFDGAAYDPSAPEKLPGVCYNTSVAGPPYQMSTTCGATVGVGSYHDSRCSHDSVIREQSTATAVCRNDRNDNSSYAILCSASVPLSSITVAGSPLYGPVGVSGLTRTRTCDYPGRCSTDMFITTYNDENCGFAIHSEDELQDNVKIGECYEMRPSLSALATSNAMFRCDGDRGYYELFASGCQGTPVETLSFSVGTCQVTGPNRSMKRTCKVVQKDTPAPVTEVNPPSSSSSRASPMISSIIVLMTLFSIAFFN